VSTIQFCGETFEVHPDGVSEWAQGEFSEAVARNAESDEESAEVVAAMMRLAVGCIADKDVNRFRAVGRKHRATFASLLGVLQDATAVTERPTGLPTDSSDGQPITDPKPDSPSVDPGLESLSGRPDLQMAIIRQRLANSA